MTIVQLLSREGNVPGAERIQSPHAEAFDAIGQARTHPSYGTIVLSVHESRVVQLEGTYSWKLAGGRRRAPKLAK